jgi:NADH-quinone oxidoreductase subunit G
MCLVEVEGMPKLQTGCTMSAQDGLVVRTGLTSEKAREGQESTLEFLLVNHPLDCPVCDKGGECPLQDLTFRHGPGNTRMTFPKRTFEKPIPISPTIALDRERCILCYRCTRFSESVAEDGELVAVNRGASSMIATFEDEPYRGRFSGNVIELCPVGALTSTTYRFLGRPWEIQNVPSVCGMCPVGCNVNVTMREGKVRRILSRNHPEIDRGWLCDKGRFAYSHLYARDRITDPLRRVRRRGLEEISWDEALDEAEQLLRGARGRIVTALSGSETIEQAYALAQLLRVGLDSHTALLPEESSDALDAFRLPLSAIAEANVVVVIGDEPVEDRAPIVDLWLRLARRNGAEVIRVGPAVYAAPGTAARVCRELAESDSVLGRKVRDAERAVLIWSGAHGGGGAHVAALAQKLDLTGKEGSGAFHLPATPNGRGVADAWAAAADVEPATSPQPVGLLVVSGDEAAADPNVRRLAEQAERVLAITMFHGLAVGWADLVLPGTSYLERDGSYVNLEGRLQRLRRAAIPPAPDELAWIAKLAERFEVKLSPYPSDVFDELARIAFGDLPFGELGERTALPHATGSEEPVQPTEEPGPGEGDGGLRLVRYRPLFTGPAVERVPELAFQRPRPEVELAPDDAARLGVAAGEAVTVSSNGASYALRARLNRRLAPGVARIAEEHGPELAGEIAVRKT